MGQHFGIFVKLYKCVMFILKSLTYSDSRRCRRGESCVADVFPPSPHNTDSLRAISCCLTEPCHLNCGYLSTEAWPPRRSSCSLYCQGCMLPQLPPPPSPCRDWPDDAASREPGFGLHWRHLMHWRRWFAVFAE